MTAVFKELKAERARLGTWFNRDDWQERIISFNASWFTCSMGTGICAQVMYNFPYSATWQHDIAYCFWVLDILLFLFFTTLGIIRGILHPELTKEILEDFYQTSYLGAIPITIDTIAVGFVLFYGELTGTVWFAWALYWVAALGCILVGAVVVWITTAVQEAPELSSVNGIWLLSFIPFLVTSAAGGTITPHLVPEVRGVTIAVSFLLWSIGMAMSMIILAIYFWRLIRHKLPPRDAIVSSFITVGPAGMAAYSIQNLAVAMQSFIESQSFDLHRPKPPQAPYTGSSDEAGKAYHLAVATSVHWMGILIALFFIAFATFWLAQSVLSVVWLVPKQFSVGHWSFVFPNAVYSNGLSMMSKDLNNHGLRGWAAAMSTITIILWLYCALGTFYKGVWKGQLFFAPGLEGWNERKALDLRSERRKSSIAPVLQSNGAVPDGLDEENRAQNAGDAEMLEDFTAKEHRPDGTYAVVKGKRRRRPGANNV